MKSLANLLWVIPKQSPALRKHLINHTRRRVLLCFSYSLVNRLLNGVCQWSIWGVSNVNFLKCLSFFCLFFFCNSPKSTLYYYLTVSFLYSPVLIQHQVSLFAHQPPSVQSASDEHSCWSTQHSSTHPVMFSSEGFRCTGQRTETVDIYTL